MSGNTSIVSLNLPGYEFDIDADWRYLPKMLQQLSCLCIGEGPPSRTKCNGAHTLACLKRLVVDVEGLGYTHTHLHPLAQVLRAAPVLSFLTVGFPHNTSKFTVNCKLDETTYATIAADLVQVQQNMGILFFNTVAYRVQFPEQGPQASACDVIATLPCMAGVAQCALCNLVPGELRGLLQVFPDVQLLKLEHDDDVELGNAELLELTACSQLTHLEPEHNNQLTGFGLLLLCQRLPKLCSIVCRKCPQLTEPILQECVELLQGFNRLVKMTIGS